MGHQKTHPFGNTSAVIPAPAIAAKSDPLAGGTPSNIRSKPESLSKVIPVDKG